MSVIGAMLGIPPLALPPIATKDKTMTHDEMIAVIEAHKRGEVVEYRSRYEPVGWHEDIVSAGWNFDRYEYRIKPKEPREWWIRIAEYPNEDIISDQPVEGYIHVREVL